MTAQAFSTTYDDSRFPLVLVTPRGAATDDEFAAYLASLERPWLRRERYLLIIDGTNIAPNTATQRRMAAEWLRVHDALIKQFEVAVVFVVPSMLLRRILTVILWLQPHPAPLEMTATLGEAESWVHERALKAGLRVPLARAR